MESRQLKQVTLAELQDGAIEERFQRELKEVMRNIADENTNPEAKRSIRIELMFKPNRERSHIGTAISVQSKLAPIYDIETGISAIRTPAGELLAYDPAFKQHDMFDKDKVVSITKGEGEK